MAIHYINNEQKYVGLSTDDKDAISADNGALLYIADTKVWYVKCDGTWYDYVISVKTIT